MSQRECAGLNWPPLSIPAVEPVSISPDAVNRAGLSWISLHTAFGSSLSLCAAAPARPRLSAANGVGHEQSATVFRLLSLLPASLLPFCAGVPAIGVGQPVNFTACSSDAVCFRPSAVRPVASIFSMLTDRPPLGVFGVGQPVNCDTMPSFLCSPPRLGFFAFIAACRASHCSTVSLVFTVSATHGVGQPVRLASFARHAQPCFVPCRAFCPFDLPDTSCACGVVQCLSDKPEPLSDVRRPDARSAEIDSPEGVTRCFHVRLNKVEPTEAVLACNLLAKDNWRAALADEPEEVGPEVAVVCGSFALARRAERLAGAGAGPHGPVVGPSGEAQGVAPDADTGKEVALRKPPEVFRSHVANGPFIYITLCYQIIVD
jgi:hypothetical protein